MDLVTARSFTGLCCAHDEGAYGANGLRHITHAVLQVYDVAKRKVLKTLMDSITARSFTVL